MYVTHRHIVIQLNPYEKHVKGQKRQWPELKDM